jgi:hypothetical protein
LDVIGNSSSSNADVVGTSSSVGTMIVGSATTSSRRQAYRCIEAIGTVRTLSVPSTVVPSSWVADIAHKKSTRVLRMIGHSEETSFTVLPDSGSDIEECSEIDEWTSLGDAP